MAKLLNCYLSLWAIVENSAIGKECRAELYSAWEERPASVYAEGMPLAKDLPARRSMRRRGRVCEGDGETGCVKVFMC